MRDIQEVYNELQETKKAQKSIKKEYKDALVNANEYEETSEEMKKIREKKKQIETMTQSRMGLRWDELEKLKAKQAELEQMVTDIAMTTIMDGKTVEIKDEFNNAYEPVYKISFKKIA
jgi:predicted nuclease with TOPRIM domain